MMRPYAGVFLVVLFAVTMSLFAQESDLQEGMVIVLESSVSVSDDAVREDILQTLGRRLEKAGFSTFQVQAERNDNRFRILLPETDEIAVNDALLTFLTQPGFVEFVDLSGYEGDVQTLVNEKIFTTAQLERNPEIATDDDSSIYPTVLTGDVLSSARARNENELSLTTLIDILFGDAPPPNSGHWRVEVTFNDAGAATLKDFSSAHIGDAMGIVLDGTLLSAPRLLETVSETAVITGDFTRDETIILAEQLNTGALALPLMVTTVDTYTEYAIHPVTSVEQP